jgi:hypothetical protein
LTLTARRSGLSPQDNEDILPQEDAPDLKLSVFYLFSELFPEFVCDKERDGPGSFSLIPRALGAASWGYARRSASAERHMIHGTRSSLNLILHRFEPLLTRSNLTAAGKGGLMRLQFNKIGYEIYDKEQSRRVPAVRAKPGNPGYGFR